MAEITIKLIFNKETGKKDILIDLESDADALPIEHEQHHKSIIEKLLGQGILKNNEMGEVVITRGGNVTTSTNANTQDQNVQNKLGQGE